MREKELFEWCDIKIDVHNIFLVTRTNRFNCMLM